MHQWPETNENSILPVKDPADAASWSDIPFAFAGCNIVSLVAKVARVHAKTRAATNLKSPLGTKWWVRQFAAGRIVIGRHQNVTRIRMARRYSPRSLRFLRYGSIQNVGFRERDHGCRLTQIRAAEAQSLQKPSLYDHHPKSRRRTRYSAGRSSLHKRLALLNVGQEPSNSRRECSHVPIHCH